NGFQRYTTLQKFHQEKYNQAPFLNEINSMYFQFALLCVECYYLIFLRAWCSVPVGLQKKQMVLFHYAAMQNENLLLHQSHLHNNLYQRLLSTKFVCLLPEM